MKNKPELPMVYQHEIRHATTYIGGTLRQMLRGCKQNNIIVPTHIALLMLAQIEVIEKDLEKE